MITFTQGDNAILALTAQDGQGNAINISGASFSTQIMGKAGAGVQTFGNSKHTIVSGISGTFTLTLSPTDTALCGLGVGKEIVTLITISSSQISYHGKNALTVLSATPIA